MLRTIEIDGLIEETEAPMEPGSSDMDRTAGRDSKRSEAELFARFQSGDDDAFLQLFDRHASRVGRYCYRLIGDPDRAQDIVQDVWERLMHVRLKPETPIHNPLGLIYTIARNLCLNHLRARRGHVPLHALPEEEHPLHEQRELSRHEEMALLALERLPLPQREILILHAYSDYTFEEIALMTGDTHGAVRTKAWRARRQLRRIIAAFIEFEENYIGKGEE